MKAATASVDTYARQAWRVSVPLTKADEQELARRYRAGDQAAGNQLVMANARYAMKVAHEYVKYGYALEDLIQEANMGMIRALRHFEPTRNARFISYATWWIKAYLRNYVMYNVSIVKFGTTQNQRTCVWKIGAVVSRLRTEHPYATEQELFDMAGAELGLEPQEAEVIFRRTHRSNDSLQETLDSAHETGSQTFQDMLVDDRPLPDERVMELQCKQRLGDLARSLCRNIKERYIVEQRLLAEKPLTLTEIGTAFNVSRERVRQIEEHLVARIKAAF